MQANLQLCHSSFDFLIPAYWESIIPTNMRMQSKDYRELSRFY